MVYWDHDPNLGRTPTASEAHTMTAPRTPSTKLNRVIDQAEAGGLDVAVEQHHDTPNIESWSVTVRMPDELRPARNALESYHLSKRISVHALRWGVGAAKPFKLHIREYGMVGDRKIRPAVLPYSVEGMIRDLAELHRYREEASS